MTPRPNASTAPSIPKLLEILVCPVTKGPLEFDGDQAGTDLALGQARLSDPRRHPDHAAGRGEEDRLRPGLALRVLRVACGSGIDQPRNVAGSRRHQAVLDVGEESHRRSSGRR